MNNKVEILHYRSALAYNREVFLLKYPFVVADFETIDNNFGLIMKPLHSGRDCNGRSQIALLPFLALAQRQCRSAFEALSSFRSYETWLLLRPAIESTLICGKWIDDPENGRIWADRKKDPKRYQKAYQGTALRSKSLAISEQLQLVLKSINDDFVHPNPDYYQRHLLLRDIDDLHVGMAVSYTDEEYDTEASLYAMFSLVLAMQAGLVDMLSKLFSQLQGLDVGLIPFLKKYIPRVKVLVASHPSTGQILRDFGLWRLDAQLHAAERAERVPP